MLRIRIAVLLCTGLLIMAIQKLYGHLYDDLLKLKYLHQRYTNYLRWLRAG